MTSPIDKYKQRQAIQEKHKQMEIPLELIKIQDQYNRQNLKKQHEFNLEIFEKQAALTREINAKQSNLTKVLIISTILAAICGSAIGALLPNFMKNIWPQNEQQKKQVIESPLHQQKSTEVQSHPSQKIKTKQSTQEASFPKSP
mgnify:CR=1 FL=1